MEGDPRNKRDRARGVLTAVLAIAAITAAGCGESADSNNAETAADNTPRSDAAEVRALLVDLQAAYIDGDADRYCAGLTPRGREIAGWFGRQIGRGKTCKQLISRTSRATNRAGVEQKPTKVLAVKVNGNRAIATVSDGGRPPAPLVFKSQNGDWKLQDPGFRALIKQLRQANNQAPTPLQDPN